MKYKQTYKDNLEQYISQNSLYVYGLIAFISLAVLIVYFLPALVRMDVYSDDLRALVPWFYSSQDPELFQNDLTADYALSLLPLGYKALFRVVSTTLDPQIFAELLPFVLAFCTLYFAYAIGYVVTHGSQVGGIANIGLFLFGATIGFPNFMQIFGGATPRAFGSPILLFGIWALFSRNLYLLSLAFLLAALFYPPVFICLVTYSGIVLLIYFIKERRIVKGSSILAGITVICLCLLFWDKLFSSGSQWTLLSLDDLLRMPEYYPGGISSVLLFYEDWGMYISNAFPSNVFLFFTVTILFLWRSKFFRLEAVILIISWLLLYTVAYLFLLNLYFPVRYVHRLYYAFYFIVLPSLFLNAINFFKRKIRNYSPQWFIHNSIGQRTITIILVVGITISSGTLTLLRISKGHGGIIGSAPGEVYEFLSLLPKNVMIAADPYYADDLPIRTKRKTLVMSEFLASPLHKEIDEEMKARTTAIWGALYASDLKPIQSLRDKYNVDVLLINRQHYKQELLLGKPLDKIFQKFQADLKGRKPLLFSLPKETVIFSSGDFVVFDLRRLPKEFQ